MYFNLIPFKRFNFSVYISTKILLQYIIICFIYRCLIFYNKWIKFFEQKCCTFNNFIEIVKISSTFFRLKNNYLHMYKLFRRNFQSIALYIFSYNINIQILMRGILDIFRVSSMNNIFPY